MSLRLRLSLGITVVLVVFFALVGVFEYRILTRSFTAEVDKSLLVQASLMTRQLQSLLAQPEGLSARVLSQVNQSSPSFQARGAEAYLQLSRPDGTLLLQSDNLRGMRVPVSNSVERPEKALRTITLADGSEVRFLTTVVADPTSGSAAVELVLGDALGLVDAAALSATRWLIVARAIELGLTLLVALMVLSRGLSPLRRVAETAERIIESGDVSQRVEGGSPQDEVGRIASSFNEVVAKVESLLVAQKRLLADTSHELRNPLTVIRTNVDFLSKDIDADTRHEVADETEREIKRMISLVEDLMLLSKTENTRQVKMEPVRLDRLAREAVERLAPTASDGRAVELGSCADPVVLGDEDRLRQIFINLIGNALRYTNAGGHVRVWVERRKDMGVAIVQDNGIGIAAEHLPHLFERFYRVDTARSRATGGSGLGLAIVKALVDAHGGRIEVESAPGKGSTFTVSIPLEEAEKPRITNLMPVLED